MIHYNVCSDEEGTRLDRLLRKRLALTSLSRIYLLVRKGRVRVNGKARKENYRLKENDVVDIDIHDSEMVKHDNILPDSAFFLADTDFYRRNFRIIYEDESLLVCDKPSGLVVHGGSGHQSRDTLVDLAASYLLRKQGNANKFVKPELVHRLDKDTSGIVLLAKDKKILRFLHRCLRDHEIKKEYMAICHGMPSKREGSVKIGLKKIHERNEGTKVRVCEGGMWSESSYRVLSLRGRFSRIAIDLHTGRTHQIRVHMSHLGCPIVGDRRYGNRDLDREIFQKPALPFRLFLHASSIEFFNPNIQKDMRFETEDPAEFNKFWNSLNHLIA